MKSRTDHSVTLAWEAAEASTFAPVEGYVIEYNSIELQQRGRPDEDTWSDALQLLQSGTSKRGPRCTWKPVTKLCLGADLLSKFHEHHILSADFRVRAVNRIGPSRACRPVESVKLPVPDLKDVELDSIVEEERITQVKLERSAPRYAFSTDGFEATTFFKGEADGADEVAHHFIKMGRRFCLYCHEDCMGLPYLFGLLTGVYRPFEKMRGHREEPADKFTPKAEQLNMAYTRDSKDFNNIPDPTRCDASVYPLSDGYADTPAPQENLTFLKLFLQGSFLDATSMGRLSRPRCHTGLYALLTALLFVPHQPGEALRGKLPLFPLVQNMEALRSPNGVRCDKGQVAVFLREAFSLAVTLCGAIPLAAAPLALLSSGMPEGIPAADATKDADAVKDAAADSEIEERTASLLRNLEGKHSFATAAETVLTRAQLHSALPELSNRSTCTFDLPALPASVPGLKVASTRALLTMQPVDAVADTSAEEAKQLKLELLTPLHAFAKEHTIAVRMLGEAERQGAATGQTTRFAVDGVEGRATTPAAIEFVSGLKKDLRFAAEKAASGGSAICLRSMGVAQRAVLILAIDAMVSDKRLETEPLKAAFVGAKASSVAEVKQVIEEVGTVSTEHTTAGLEAWPRVQDLEVATESLLEAASTVLSALHTQLDRLAGQLRTAVGGEREAMRSMIDKLERDARRPDSLRQQFFQEAQLAATPSFVTLLSSVLSTSQAEDLATLDSKLLHVLPALNCQMICAQLRSCRLQLLAMCSMQARDLQHDLLDLNSRLLEHTYMLETPFSPMPSQEILEAVLWRNELHLASAAIDLRRTMRQLVGDVDATSDEPTLHERLLGLGLSEDESTRVGYMLAALCGFVVGRVRTIAPVAFSQRAEDSPAHGLSADLTTQPQSQPSTPQSLTPRPTAPLMPQEHIGSQLFEREHSAPKRSGGDLAAPLFRATLPASLFTFLGAQEIPAAESIAEPKTPSDAASETGGDAADPQTCVPTPPARGWEGGVEITRGEDKPGTRIGLTELQRMLELAERGLCWNQLQLSLPPAAWINPAATSGGVQRLKAVEVQVLGQKASTLAAMLRSTRSFVADVQPGASHVSFDPRYLAFEFSGKFMLRELQGEIVKELHQSALEGKSRCRQMIMGGGKSSVIAPLLGLLLADGERLVMMVVPDQLLDMSVNVTRGAYGPSIATQVFVFGFERSSGTEMLKSLRRQRRRLSMARSMAGIVCATPGAVKSLFLSYIDRLQQEVRAPRLVLLSRSVIEKHAKAVGCTLKGSTLDALDPIGKAMSARAAEAELLRDILCTFKSSVALVDEVDWVLHPLKSELNFPIGARKPLQLTRAPTEEGKEDDGEGTENKGNGRRRWTLPIELLDGIFAALGDFNSRVTSKARDTIEKLKQVVQTGADACRVTLSPHFVLLQKSFYESAMKPLLAELALAWFADQEGVKNALKQAEAELPAATARLLIAEVNGKRVRDVALLHFILGDDDVPLLMPARRPLPRRGKEGPPPPPKEQAQSAVRCLLAELQGTEVLALLNLCRTYVCSLLPHVLSKRSRIDFGLLSDEDAIRLKKLELEELQQRFGSSAQTQVTKDELLLIPRLSRELLAVPFVGKDAASRSSEFAHPEVILGLTVNAYRVSGLRARDMKRLLTAMLHSFGKDTNPRPYRKDRLKLQEWKRDATRRWAALHGDEEEPPEVLDLELLQPGDKKHIQAMVALLGRHPPTINHYLDTIVFELTQQDVLHGGGYAQEKLSASGMDLGSGAIFGATIGFSGTPSNLVPEAMRPCKPEDGDDAQMIKVLTDPAVVSVQLWGTAWTSDDLLMWVAKHDPPFHALIDTGALITGRTNESVARFCLENGLSWARAAVFLDAQDRKMVAFKEGGPALPLEQCSLSPGARFSFYDQVHTTGMDIKQSVDARAACTLGKGMVLRDHTQACWRMRQIGRGQTLTTVIVPEVVELVHEVSNEADDYTGDDQRGWLHDIISWLISNSLEVEGLMQSQLVVQEAKNIPRRAALDWLLQQPVVPPPASGEEASAEARVLAGAAPEEGKAVPCFDSQLVPQAGGDEQLKRLLEEEIPDADKTIGTLVLNLKLPPIGKEVSGDALHDTYRHIRSSRDAIETLARNCAAAPPDANFGQFDSAVQLIECVCQWSNILDNSRIDLFDPDEGGSLSEKDQREMTQSLYNQMQYIDNRFLKLYFDVPVGETFAGSAFAPLAKTKQMWKDKAKACGAQDDQADASLTGVYPLNEKHELAKTLTSAVFDELTRLPPPADGFTLQQAMRPALADPGNAVGMVAASPATYDRFRCVFDPLIAGFHSGFDPSSMVHRVSGEFCTLQEDASLTAELDALSKSREIASIRFCCSRNLAGLPFLPAASSDSRRTVYTTLKRALESLPAEFQGIFRGFEDLEAVEYEQLLEADVAFAEPTGGLLRTAGAADDWPQDRAVFYNSDRSRSLRATVNESDHLSLVLTHQGGDARSALSSYTNLLALLREKVREQTHDFAWHDRLGWVGFSPARLGTALDVSLHIRLHNGQEADMAVGDGVTPICEGLGLKLAAKPNPVESRGLTPTQKEEAIREAHSWWELRSGMMAGCTEADMVQRLVRGATRLLERDHELMNSKAETLKDLRKRAATLRKARKGVRAARIESNPSDRACMTRATALAYLTVPSRLGRANETPLLGGPENGGEPRGQGRTTLRPPADGRVDLAVHGGSRGESAHPQHDRPQAGPTGAGRVGARRVRGAVAQPARCADQAARYVQKPPSHLHTLV